MTTPEDVPPPEADKQPEQTPDSDRVVDIKTGLPLQGGNASKVTRAIKGRDRDVGEIPDWVNDGG